MGLIEPFKKWKRTLDIYMTAKRAVISFLVLCLVLYYMSPNISLLFSDSTASPEGYFSGCIEKSLRYYSTHLKTHFVFTTDDDSDKKEDQYLPFVGNGIFGVTFHPTPTVYLKNVRTLSLDTQWNPLLTFSHSTTMSEVFVMNILTGTVSHYQCFSNGISMSSIFFAHRTNPHLFYQDIVITNPTDELVFMKLDKMNYPDWITNNSPKRVSEKKSESQKILTFSGILKNYTNEASLAVCFSVKNKPQSFEIPAHQTKHIYYPVIIHQERMDAKDFISKRAQLEGKCIDAMNSAESFGSLHSHQVHVSAWKKLWNTGLSISHSKASGALNDDRINATLYYVLSNVVMNSKQNSIGTVKHNVSNYISLAEGCYGGYHHTLQAPGLWKKLNTFKEVNTSVSLWLLTLEKQGCHKLLLSGAEDVLQAMVLSFGGFRFSAHHLEFKIDPKFLHRDYYFRNINVDYNVHINVSVILQDDNKAVLGVSIDRTDKEYYACDGGCVNAPVQLRKSESYFPVIMTEPITSILYITSDKNHIELIKDTLHVHKIVEAPAHDHHVVALHRHGSHLGGLPLMFWATVITLIIIFHLFLCKLICNEYCGKQDKIKGRYARV